MQLFANIVCKSKQRVATCNDETDFLFLFLVSRKEKPLIFYAQINQGVQIEYPLILEHYKLHREWIEGLNFENRLISS